MNEKMQGRPFTSGDKRINRKGRPSKGAALAEILRADLDQVKDGKTRLEIIAQVLSKKAEYGDVPVARP